MPSTAFYSGKFNWIYPEIVNAAKGQPSVVARGTKSRELHPALMEVSSPRERLVTSYGRPINVTFAMAEVLWILGGKKDVESLAYYNSRIGEFSDNGKDFNAAYGWRLRKAHGYDQIEDAVRTLRAEPDSRQVSLTLWHPNDRGWDSMTAGPREFRRRVTKDRACNVYSHLLIRHGRLDWLQVIRSNDIVLGLPYNWMQFTHLQEYIAERIGVGVGVYTQLSDSLHIYEDTYYDGDSVRVEEFDLYWSLQHEHAVMDVSMVPFAISCEESIRKSSQWREIVERAFLGDYWNSVMPLFAAHRSYKDGDDKSAVAFLSKADPVLGAAQARFYFQMRWKKDSSFPVVNLPWPEDVIKWICAEAQ